MLDRRELLTRAGMAALIAGLGSPRAFALDTVTLPFDNGERPLVRYPQKRPMIGLTERPPQLETPLAIFNDGPITPNNAFFVRYHLADVPYDIEAYEPRGCARCKYSGYKGRVGLYEAMTMTHELRELAIERASADSIRRMAVQQGMQLLHQDGFDKVRKGVTSIEEVARVTGSVPPADQSVGQGAA